MLHPPYYPNYFAYKKIEEFLTFYDSLKNSTHYSSYIEEWLGKSLPSPIKALEDMEYEAVPPLMDFIKDYLSIPISKEHIQDFCCKFWISYKNHCKNVYSNNIPGYRTAIAIERSDKRQKSIVNECFKRLQLPYMMQKKNNTWTIKVSPTGKDMNTQAFNL